MVVFDSWCPVALVGEMAPNHTHEHISGLPILAWLSPHPPRPPGDQGRWGDHSTAAVTFVCGQTDRVMLVLLSALLTLAKRYLK